MLTLINGAENAQVETRLALCNLLGQPEGAPLTSLFVNDVRRPGAAQLDGLLAATVKIMADHRIKRNLTDWPFAHFWDNPSEPRHSKLLGYFLDPEQDHGCGAFLLDSLLRFLQAKGVLPDHRPFPVEGCRVLAENGYMDLRVEQDHPDGRFAILIENKVNGAADQHLQLSDYAGKLRARGFAPTEIFVLYAPLGPGRQPAANDLAALDALGVRWWRVVPFSTHVLPWLRTVLDDSGHDEGEPDRPVNMERGMRENLGHYHDLLRYLVNQGKTEHMNQKIIQQIRDIPTLPTINDVDDLKAAADRLRECLMTVWRAKLFLRAQQLLQAKGAETRFYDGDHKEMFPAPNSEFDERFCIEVNLALQVTDAVRVCFGGYQEGGKGENFWTGYMRSGEDPTEQARIEPIVAAVSGYRAPNPDTWWYAWQLTQKVHHGNCSEESAVAHVANTLLDMRQRLLPHLGGDNNMVE